MILTETYKNFFFNDLCKDRVNPYEIDTELRIRKILENYTGYQFEIRKNEDPYAYDLVVYFYDTSNVGSPAIPLIFVEIEQSETWKDKYPSNWKAYSFLARKVFKFDKTIDAFTNELKDNANKTIYIIFNQSLTDCIAQKVSFIAENYNLVRSTKTFNSYNDWVLRTPVDNSHLVVRGIEKTMSKIMKFIERHKELFNQS